MIVTIAVIAGGILLGSLVLLSSTMGMVLSQADLIGMVFFAIGGVFVWRLAMVAAAPQDQVWLPRVVVASQFIRAFWCFARRTFLSGFAQRYIEWEDAFGRDVFAEAQASAWRYGLAKPELPGSLSEAHNYVVWFKTAVLYYVFGASPLIPQAIVTTGAVSICVAVYWIIATGRFSWHCRRLPVLICAFLPSFIFWHTLDNKDVVTATCAAWSVVGLFWQFERGARSVVGLVLLVSMDFLCTIYRPYVGLLLITGQGLAWAYATPLPNTPLGHMARTWLFVAIAPVALWIGAKEMKQTYGERMGLEWAVENYMVFRESGIQAGVRGSEYAIPLTASTPAQAIVQLPLRILLLLFSPIPFIPGSFRRMLTYPEQWFIYIYVIPRLYHGIRVSLKKKPFWAATVLLTLAPVVVAYSIKTAVSGEAARMRTQFMPEIFAFAGIGQAVMEQARQVQRRARPAAVEFRRNDV